MLSKARNWMFDNIHGNNLIYNCCWEDPRCDRNLLDFDSESKVVMITSAGCNALDYLLDDPKEIHCVDMNYRQNALLDFKLSTFQNTDFPTLFQFFARGWHPDSAEIYGNSIRKMLSTDSKLFWDKKLKYFSGKGSRSSFYYNGTSGTVAWMMKNYMRTQRKFFRRVQELLTSTTLEAQEYWYSLVEKKLDNGWMRWLLGQPFTLSLLGVPEAQSRLIQEKYIGGITQFMMDSLRYVFTQLPIAENYFWYLYIMGHYTKDCSPSYLKEQNFETLQDRSDRVKTYTTTFEQFLRDNPDQYSHFILLDHQDWLAAHNVPALEKEWHAILDNSRKGTKVIMRSAAHQINFLPDFVLDAVDFEIMESRARQSHKIDRVGTYGCTQVGIVR